MARRGRYNRRRRSGRFSFVYKLLCFVLICAAAAVGLSLFFKIDTIQVTGSSRYTPDQVLEASGIQVGDNLFLMNKNRAAANITSGLPYVETVQIRRRIPATLQVTVTECTSPAAIRQDGKVWLLSGEGKVVDCVAAAQWSRYTQVTGITLDAPEVGKPAAVQPDQEHILQELGTLLAQLETKDMLSQTQAIHLEDASMVVLRYMDRFDVTFRWNADFDYKLEYLKAVVERLEVNETGTIDMTQEGKASFIPK